MNVNGLNDLRFVIGLFFGLISLILLFAGVTTGTQLNLFVGIFIGFFSVLMLLFSYLFPEKDIS